MSTDDTTQPPQAQVRLLVNQHGLISGVRFTKQTPDVVFGDPEVVRIKPSGEVVIAEGANLDDAALAFWHAITEWRSTASRPTLADVQPGGRVRLATVLYDRAHDLLGDAYNAGTHGIGYSQQAMELHDAIIPAHPSPGGQDAPVTDEMVDAACRAYYDTAEDAVAVDHTCMEAALKAALAARQPSKQPDSVALGEATEFCTEKGDRQPVGQSFQSGVSEWMGQCFLPSLYSNMTERGDRLLEEVLELLQAHGYDKARVPTLVDYVFGRPVGEPAQEVGGVMVTLAGYCWVAGLDMHAAGDAELARITQPDVMAKIRAKQEAKNALHFDTPLPGSADAHLPAQAMDLSQFRDALVWAEDAADCSSHPDHKAYRFAFTELLGMIDSKAERNG